MADAAQVRRAADGNPVLVAALERIKARAEGRRLAPKDPALAREVGVGRPDLPGADDYGPIDVNHAPPGVLLSVVLESDLAHGRAPAKP